MHHPGITHNLNPPEAKKLYASTSTKDYEREYDCEDAIPLCIHQHQRLNENIP